MKKLYKLKDKNTGLYFGGSGGYKTISKVGRVFKNKPSSKQFGSMPTHKGKVLKANDF